MQEISINNDLPEMIRAHRKIAGLTQKQLAEYSDVGKTVVFDLEHGKTSIQLNILLKILNTLNISIQFTSPLTEN